MKELFTYLFDFSIVTSIAILLAILLRPILKKGPSFVRCILWALVFLRLLVPVGLAELPIAAGDLSVSGLFESAEEAVSLPQDEGNLAGGGNLAGDSVVNNDAVQDPAQTPIVTLPAVQKPASDAIPEQGDTVSAPAMDQEVPQLEPAPQPKAEIDLLFVLSIVWAAGVVAMLGYMLASNLLLRYRVRDAIVYDSRIRIISRDCSPFVFGFFRPIIYIPASVSKTDWPHIIAHETSHIKRFDHVLKPLAFFVLCFYWFNPLVWAAYILLGKDIEYACDERTVKRMESNDRKAYSLALLAVSQGGNIVFAPPLSFGKVSVKERIKRVMNRKIPMWAMCLTIVICAALLVLATLTPVAGDGMDAEPDDQSSAESGSGSSDPDIELAISVAYADPAEPDEQSLLYDEQGQELVKIWVNKEVKAFKFIEVLYDDNTDPYAGDALYEVATLAPDTPFYAQTVINEGFSDRGISFADDNGQTVAYRIMYDSYAGESTGDSLYLERIAYVNGENSDPSSDPSTYEEVLALHRQAPQIYRDPGELQVETKEMIRLEDGQWYQSYVSERLRYVFLSEEEAEVPGLWDFVAVGSAENYFLFNVGVLYDDPSGMKPYAERPIAVRGTLSEGTGEYAYVLQLPDELIVCVEQPANPWDGTCYFTETETLAIPESYAYLFKGMVGEVIVTGVVMQDENGVFYLRGASEGSNGLAETGPRAYSMPSVIRKSGYTLNIQYEDGGLTIRSDGDFYYRYTWDAQGRLTGEHFSWCNFLYEYDADGLLTLELQKDGYGKEIMRTEYTYNEQGECVDAKVTASPERWESRQEHTYDAAGNLVTEIQYTDGTVEAWRLEYKYDGNGNMVQKLQYSDSGDQRTFYEYDESGKLVKETCEDLEGNLVSYGLYAYDENGLCREKELFLPDIDAIITSELRETVEVTLSEEAFQTVLRVLLAHY